MNYRRRRITLLIILVLLAVVGLWLRREIRHNALNQQLVAALAMDDTNRALLLVNSGADPNTPCNPPSSLTFRWLMNHFLHLHTPATSAFLLACGTGYGWYSDEIAQLRHHPDDSQLIQVMLANGADLHAVTDYKQSALLGAVTEYHIRVAEVLVKHGINVDARDKLGQTPLMWAAMDIEPDMVRLLLAHGANVHIQDQVGYTALFYAVWSGGNADIIQQLLAHGADPNLRDKMGQTAITYAKYSPKITSLLPKRAM